MHKVLLRYCIFLLFLAGCIGTDDEDPIDPILRISSMPDLIRVNQSYLFTSEYFDQFARKKTVQVSWTSSNPAILEIDQDGKATARSEGLVTVFVKFGDLEDFIEVKVVSSEESVVISGFPDILTVGESFQFMAVYTDIEGGFDDSQAFSWSSLDPAIFSVESDGTVTARSEGTGRIRVAAGNVSDTVTLKSSAGMMIVEEKAMITKFATKIDENESFGFEAVYFDNMGQAVPSPDIVWESSDTSILTINEEGVAVAKSSGKVTIFVKNKMGEVLAQLVVEVIKPTSESSTGERTVTLQGSGGYRTSGEAILKASVDGLMLELTNLMTNGPVPYAYLSSSSSNVSVGVKLGEVMTGSNTFNVSNVDPDITLEQFDYVVIWCEAFGVTLGFGELNK